jgi:hypothetical protein
MFSINVTSFISHGLFCIFPPNLEKRKCTIFEAFTSGADSLEPAITGDQGGRRCENGLKEKGQVVYRRFMVFYVQYLQCTERIYCIYI